MYTEERRRGWGLAARNAAGWRGAALGVGRALGEILRVLYRGVLTYVFVRSTEDKTGDQPLIDGETGTGLRSMRLSEAVLPGESGSNFLRQCGDLERVYRDVVARGLSASSSSENLLEEGEAALPDAPEEECARARPRLPSASPTVPPTFVSSKCCRPDALTKFSGGVNPMLSRWYFSPLLL